MRNPTLPCHTRTWVQLEMATFRVLPFTCRLSHLEKQSRTQVGSSTTVPHTYNEPKHFEKRIKKKTVERHGNWERCILGNETACPPTRKRDVFFF